MSECVTEIEARKGELARLADERAAVLRGRRKFLSTVSLAGAALGATAMSGCGDDGPVTIPATNITLVDVLQFALNLEYLEASFYAYVATGSGLPAADMGSNPGSVTGGAKVTFTNSVIASAANQLATEEREHVELLRSAISSRGFTPVDMPALNLAAMGTVNSDATFLTAARQLEAVGVSAYAGGAQYLVSDIAALNYAAQILHTEAQHAGFLRELCIVNSITSAAVDSQDQAPTLSKIFNTSATTGLNPVRTPSQVLQIVYGTPGQVGATRGGFFPNGLNGSLTIS